MRGSLPIAFSVIVCFAIAPVASPILVESPGGGRRPPRASAPSARLRQNVAELARPNSIHWDVNGR